ncbi:MAG: hypothetical protein K2P95_07780, partial [Hyphomonadaceae bacterium]|nr:hypothetical protein [Hyphomonadaceae bacterium]
LIGQPRRLQTVEPFAQSAPRAQQAQPRPNPAAAGEPDGARGLLEALQGIEHGPLRAALARLGRAVDCPPPRR